MPAEPTSADLIKRYIELRDWMAAQSKKFKEFLQPYREEMAAIEGKMLAKINSEGGKAISTDFGVAYTSETMTPKVEDRQKYLDWLWGLSDEEWITHGNAMLQLAAPQVDAVREYMEDHQGQLPPGVTKTDYRNLNIRKS